MGLSFDCWSHLFSRIGLPCSCKVVGVRKESLWAPYYLFWALGPSTHLTEPTSVSLGFWAGLRGAGKGYVFAQVRCPLPLPELLQIPPAACSPCRPFPTA